MGLYIFQVKGLAVMDYIMNIHIGILMDGLCWATRWDHDWEKINIVFSWHGKLQFQNMKQKSVDASGRYFLRGVQLRTVEHPTPQPPAAPSPAMPAPAPKKDEQQTPNNRA